MLNLSWSLQNVFSQKNSKKNKTPLFNEEELTMFANIASKLTIVTLCAASALFAGEVQKPELTPEKIIAKMAETYAGCKSYRDAGNVKTVYISDKRTNISERPFSTAFVRPDQFRFEYKEKVDSYVKENPCYIVWRKGSEILTWFNVYPNTVEKAKSFSSAISGATGVSGGSAHTVPVLLMPELGGSKLSDIKEAKLLEDSKLDDADCFRIQGKFISLNKSGKTTKKPTVIWIDKKTFLLRRIENETVFIYAKFTSKTTTTYYPAVNCAVSPKLLEFAPPGGTKTLKSSQPARKPMSFSLDSPRGDGLHDKKEASRLFFVGYNLSIKQGAEQEQKFLKEPKDLNQRIIVMGYLQQICKKDSTARKKLDEHILWMIENHPDAAILDPLASMLELWSKRTAQVTRKAWIEQIKKNPGSPQVFWNAASGVSAADQALMAQWYEKGQALEPEDPKWAERLGNYYFHARQSAKSLEEYKKAYPKGKNKVYMITRMAKSALDCAKLKEAEKYAREMQHLAEKYGDKDENGVRLLFNANLVLGGIALKQGKTAEAGRYLLKAGEKPDSLRRNPDFTLAKNLLKAGQKDVVLQFIQSCSKFWSKALCEKWIKQIKEGKVPNFKS
jgi:tetratricopeptide (TPR) repeat protein